MQDLNTREDPPRAWSPQSFSSPAVERSRAGAPLVQGGLRVHLPRALGFCYGVERAVALAAQTRQRFPERRVFLTGEIVHNPRVRERLEGLGIHTLAGRDPGRLRTLGPEDVVLVPAFGNPLPELAQVQARGCLVVDTTCGSVLVVWKHAERWAAEGRTVVLHGKVGHPEARATCSRVEAGGAPWLLLRDLEQTEALGAVIRGQRPAASLGPLLARAASPGFDPARDLERLGCANQTTMLASESLAVAERLRAAVLERWGPAELPRRFASLDTICSATQERQDALRELLERPLDLVLVVGGFDSSNTSQLVRIAAGVRPTFHVDGPGCLLSPRAIRHLPPGGRSPLVTWRWLDPAATQVAVTAGASTPPSEVEAVIQRLFELRTLLGHSLPTRGPDDTQALPRRGA